MLKNNLKDKSFSEDFEYTHQNPYHDKLKSFDHFVLRDNEPEKFKNKWNEDCFNRSAILNVEVGTGYGHFMMDYCKDHPEENFVGMDYRFKRSFNLAKKLKLFSHINFRYLRAKGERLEHLFGENEIDNFYYFFPDPWPKTRHQKKRLFQESFIKILSKVMKKDGVVYIKTDHDDYYASMINVINSTDHNFEVLVHTTDLHQEEHPNLLRLQKYITKFEKIFLAKNKNINAVVLRCK